MCLLRFFATTTTQYGILALFRAIFTIVVLIRSAYQLTRLYFCIMARVAASTEFSFESKQLRNLSHLATKIGTVLAVNEIMYHTVNCTIALSFCYF